MVEENYQSDFSLPKRLILRSPADFRRVYEHRHSVSDALLVVYGRANELQYSRLGLSVSRKVGNAVRRNRLRRLYREAFRLSKNTLPPGLDLILIPRAGEEPSLAQLLQSLPCLAARLARRLLNHGSRPEKSP